MQRKEPADWVFFNVKFSDKEHEAIAIYQNRVVDMGSIPYIFSNYRGFKDFNGQGFNIGRKDGKSILMKDSAEGIVVFTEELSPETIIWQMEQGKCIEKHIELLDPDWDDH